MDADQARLDRSEAHPLAPQDSRMGDDLRPPAMTPGHRLGGGVREREQVGCPCHQELEVKIVPAGIGVVRVAQIVDGVDERDPRTVQLIAPRRQPDGADVVEPEVQVGDVDRVRVFSDPAWFQRRVRPPWRRRIGQRDDGVGRRGGHGPYVRMAGRNRKHGWAVIVGPAHRRLNRSRHGPPVPPRPRPEPSPAEKPPARGEDVVAPLFSWHRWRLRGGGELRIVRRCCERSG